jgi:hypothetical protein
MTKTATIGGKGRLTRPFGNTHRVTAAEARFLKPFAHTGFSCSGNPLKKPFAGSRAVLPPP